MLFICWWYERTFICFQEIIWLSPWEDNDLKIIFDGRTVVYYHKEKNITWCYKVKFDLIQCSEFPTTRDFQHGLIAWLHDQQDNDLYWTETVRLNWILYKIHSFLLQKNIDFAYRNSNLLSNTMRMINTKLYELLQEDIDLLQGSMWFIYGKDDNICFNALILCYYNKRLWCTVILIDVKAQRYKVITAQTKKYVLPTSQIIGVYISLHKEHEEWYMQQDDWKQKGNWIVWKS